MAACWSKHNRAPTTIFSSGNTLSPRQVANKALTLGCKKLDRDNKRSRPCYGVRERLLLCITIARAEEVLNKRTRRHNRRVMAAEEDDDANRTAPQSCSSAMHVDKSPLRSSETSESESDPQPHPQPSSSPSLSSSSPSSCSSCSPPPTSPPLVVAAATPTPPATSNQASLEDQASEPISFAPISSYNNTIPASAAPIVPRDCRPIVTQSVATPTAIV